MSKSITQTQEDEMKRSQIIQKREYRMLKDGLKKDYSGEEYRVRVDAIQAEQQEKMLQQQQTNKDFYKLEIRKFRRRKLIQYHQLERDLLNEELNRRQHQLDLAHEMLVRHHVGTQEIEYQQQRAIHQLRDEQIRKQHNTELNNQKEYNNKRLVDVHKKHALEVKQQPKSLKQKELQIRKQFRETCKTQTLQVSVG